MKKNVLLANDRKFRSYYERHLKPLEEQFEQNRNVCRAERNKRIAAAIFSWLSMIVLGFWWFDSAVDFGWWMLPFAALFSGILLGLWAWLPMMLQYGQLKESILPRLIPFFGDLKFTWDAELSMSQFSASRLIPRHNKIYVEDLIEGSYTGVPLRFAEISLKEETTHYRASDTTSSSRRIEKVFKGLLVELTLDHGSHGVTLAGSSGMFKDYFAIKSDSELQAGRSGTGFESHATPGARPAIRIDDVLFKQLGELKTLFAAKRLALSLYDQKLLILIERTEDFFEISAEKQIDFARDAELVGQQLGQIFSIIEHLGIGGLQESTDRRTESVDFTEIAGKPAGKEPLDRNAYGGWGGLLVFVLWLAGTGAFAWFLDEQIKGDERVLWSTFGGALASLGLYQLVSSLRKSQGGKLFFAGLLLGGAVWIALANQATGAV